MILTTSTMLALKPIIGASCSLINSSIRISSRIYNLRNFHIPQRRYMSTTGRGGIKGTKWNSENISPGFATTQGVSNVTRSSNKYPLDPTEEEIEEEKEVYDREFVDMKVEDFESLYKDDETGSIKSQIETILKEYEYHKYNSMGRVPSVINCLDMERTLDEGFTPTLRERLFNFFFKREMAKRSLALKKQRERAEKKAELSEKYSELEKMYGDQRRTGLLSSTGDLLYGLWHNSLFCRIPENRLKLANSDARLIEAALFGRKIVFDFGFEDYMTPQTCRNSMDQVQEAYGVNRYKYQEPLDLWFCNFDKNSRSGSYLIDKCMPNLYDGSMVTVKSDCFTNHFDKSRLVYLSPDAKQTIADSWNKDDVYIVGVYNDKGSVKPLTYRKAEDLGIRSRSLPLDTFVAWQGGTKSLCLNHVLGIILEITANNGQWREALLKCVPSRKIKPLELVMEEEGRRLAKRKKLFNLRTDFEF